MINHPNCKVAQFRLEGIGSCGSFIVSQKQGPNLVVIVGDGAGWDHVSVRVDSNPRRLPTWEEMSYVKDLFFKDDEAVMQLHPPKKDHINNHEYVLHLWRPQTPAEHVAITTAYLKDIEAGIEPHDETFLELIHRPTPGAIPLPHKELV